VSAKSFATIKRAEARARMASLRRAKQSQRAAAGENRHGLADGSQGRLTNLSQAMRAMARWA
jgi:hypothetical protein